MKMLCADCGEERDFEPNGEFDSQGRPDYSCMHCGWCQTSTAGGYAELCRVATWHNLDAYVEMRDKARAGGYDVPDNPTYFRE